MADTGIFCTTAEVLRKAGSRANATSSAEAYTNDFVTQAESAINAAVGYNYSDNYSTLNVDVKGILKEAASNLAAIYVKQYDISGATMTSLQRLDGEDMINILYRRFKDCIEILKQNRSETFILGA